MLNPKTNVCRLRNGVLLSLFACFQDGRQNQTESYIVVDSLFTRGVQYVLKTAQYIPKF